MRMEPTAIPGCYQLFPPVHRDARGAFVKPFHREQFTAHGLATDFAECYHSTSVRAVLRGLHFQVPPAHHAKLVYCPHGTVFDAAVDLRRGSPAYGRHATFTLSAEQGNAVYLPAGLAHGFCVTSEEALLVYHVTTVHSPAHDTGVLWSSAGIDWPEPAPILSARDESFPALADFASPFIYEAP